MLAAMLVTRVVARVIVMVVARVVTRVVSRVVAMATIYFTRVSRLVRLICKRSFQLTLRNIVATGNHCVVTISQIVAMETVLIG